MNNSNNQNVEESVTLAGSGGNNTGSCASNLLPCKKLAEGATVVEPPKQEEQPAEARSDVKFIFCSGDSDPLQHGGKNGQRWAVDQPTPIANHHPAVWPLVITDMKSRDQLGHRRYGVALQPHNGRDVLRDAYEEALDLAVYLRSAIYERDAS